MGLVNLRSRGSEGTEVGGAEPHHAGPCWPKPFVFCIVLHCIAIYCIVLYCILISQFLMCCISVLCNPWKVLSREEAQLI